MIGCFGVAPATDGDFATVTLTNAAGDIDVRCLNTGATLAVPVFNDGALLSAAEGHALQSEVKTSSTAIECPMQMTLQVDLIPTPDSQRPSSPSPGRTTPTSAIASSPRSDPTS